MRKRRAPSVFPGLESLASSSTFGDINMKLRYILGLLCAASLSVVLAGNASAQDKTVKIGGVFPLSGNAASAGVRAKVEVVFADNQGSPATGQNQTLRLITEEKVVALTGAYQSGITLTASAIAEKYGIPLLNGESVAANLTERGFKWFFRVTPVASDFAKIYYEFLKDMKATGVKTDSVAMVH